MSRIPYMRREELGPEGQRLWDSIVDGRGDDEPDDKPVLPVQSEDETDAGWGEAPEPDDERLRRDRPPHWDQ